MNHFSHDTVASDAVHDVFMTFSMYNSLSDEVIWSRVTYNEKYLAVVAWILTAMNRPARCLT